MISFACLIKLNSARFAPVKFLFEKVGRVQLIVRDVDAAEATTSESRDSRIEKLWEAAEGVGASDFEVFDDTEIVEVMSVGMGCVVRRLCCFFICSLHAHRTY